jgi:hypothetical protein
VVEGAGSVALEELTAAVAIASEANPGVRLERQGGKFVDSRNTPPVRQVERVSADPGQRVLDMPELQDILPTGAGPKCEVLLVASSSNSASTLVFRGAHMILDGPGLEMWASDIFRVLRGEQPLGAPDTTSDKDILRKEKYESEDDTRRTRMEFRSLFEPHPTTTPRTLWRRRTVDGYHPALTATIATTIAELADVQTSRFSIPVDLRRHRPDVRSNANMTNLLILDVERGQTWEESHERLMRMLAANRDLLSQIAPVSLKQPIPIMKLPIPVLRVLNGLISAEAAKDSTYNATAGISHLGRLDLLDYCAPSFEATTVYVGSTHPPLRPTEVEIVECGGRTEIILSEFDGPGVAERADTVLDRIEEVLEKA